MGAVIFRFAILGPIIGCLVCLSTGVITGSDWQALSLYDVDKLLSLIGAIAFLSIVWGVVIAIPIGILPAALSGFIYWPVLSKFSNRNFNPASRLLIGSLISTLITTLLVSYLYISKEYFNFYWWFYAWPGTVAGAICALSVTDKCYEKIFLIKI